LDGVVWVGDNALARDAGIADDRASVFAFLEFLAAGQGRLERMRAFVDSAPPALDFFRGIGIAFELLRGVADDFYPKAAGAAAEGRMLRATEFVPSGLALLQERNVPVLLGARAIRLMTDSGRVVGVALEDGRVLGARAVVVATGGYASDPVLTGRFEDVPGLQSLYPVTARGDGLRMAGSAGGRVHLVRNNMAIALVSSDGQRVANTPAHREFVPDLRAFDAATRTFTRLPYGEFRPALIACSAGVAADVDGCVLDWRGRIVPGLYAVGDAAAHDEFGAGYQTGSSFSSAMTFALRAAKHITSTVIGRVP
jgi:succinate dehydrogenase/fumarate reductase flavoprotein subunit